MEDDSHDAELEEVLKITRELMESGEFTFDDPLSPFQRYLGKVKLEVYESHFKYGDKFGLLRAVNVCALHDLPMPDWLKKAFTNAFDKVEELEVKKLEDAFGSPLKKGEHIAAVRKKRKLANLVFSEVGVAIRDWKPVDTALFEEIGSKLGLGKTLASDYYYEKLKYYGAPPLALSDETENLLKETLFGSSANS